MEARRRVRMLYEAQRFEIIARIGLERRTCLEAFDEMRDDIIKARLISLIAIVRLAARIRSEKTQFVVLEDRACFASDDFELIGSAGG